MRKSIIPERKKIFIVFLCFLAAVTAIVAKRQPKEKIPILMYHKIGHQRPNRWWVKISDFESQMAALKRAGYKTVSFSELSSFYAGRKKLSRGKKIIITFDDGYDNFYSLAYPCLEKYGFKATIFPIINQVANEAEKRCKSTWTGEAAECICGHLTWPEIIEVASRGTEIGGHTVHHHLLSRGGLNDEELWSEVAGCKEILEEKLGGPIVVFAYPGGDYDIRVKKCVKAAGFLFALGNDGGVQYNVKNSDHFSWKRIPVMEQSAEELLEELRS